MAQFHTHYYKNSWLDITRSYASVGHITAYRCHSSVTRRPVITLCITANINRAINKLDERFRQVSPASTGARRSRAGENVHQPAATQSRAASGTEINALPPVRRLRLREVRWRTETVTRDELGVSTVLLPSSRSPASSPVESRTPLGSCRPPPIRTRRRRDHSSTVR